MPARRAVLGLLAPLLLAAGCSRGESSPPDDAAIGPALGPGDSLFDSLAAARLDRWTDVALPSPVAALIGTTVLICTPIDDSHWREGPELPEENPATAAAGVSGLKYFTAAAGARQRQGAALPEILRGGQRQPEFHPGRDSLTSGTLWYDASLDVVFGLGPAPPQDVSLRYAVLRETFSDGLPPSVKEPPTTASSLRRRAVLGETSRDALELPAPGAVSFSLARLDGDELSVAVGVADRACRVVDGALLQAPGQSDGVTFAVDIEALDEREPKATRLWERHVRPGDGWVESVVPLAAFRGRPVRLHLVTDAGPAGDAAFDEAVWGDLRLLGAPKGPPERPHVVLIDIDTLRADRLSCYGAERPTSPAIDAFAADGAAVFLDASSTAPWTLPATASMLTGLSPNQHGTVLGEQALSAKVPMLAQTLRAAGYETRGLTGGGYLLPDFGFDAGFDTYTSRADWVPDAAEVESLLADRRSERPLFLFVHTYMVHAPYASDPRFLDETSRRSALVGRAITHEDVVAPFSNGTLALGDDDRRYVEHLYEAGVARMDEALGRVLEAIDRAVPRSRVLVLITSDHGEELFEHGGMEHRGTLYRELLRVPLIVRFPDGQPAGRLAEPASLLDIVPTILDCVGLPQPANLPGLSLRQALPSARTRVAFLHHDLLSVNRGELKLISRVMPSGAPNEPVQLFDFATDEAEQQDVAASRPEDVAELRRWFDEFLEQWPPLAIEPAAEPALDAQTLEDLRRLGYVGER